MIGLGRFRAGVCTAACVALTGCISDVTVRQRALDYNLSVDQLQIQQLMLNVVRASQRKPLVFTRLGSITGTATADGTLAVTIPLTLLNDNAKSLAPTLDINSQTQITVNNLDTAEFYTSILTPLKGQTLDLLAKRGFPIRPLMTLAISSIEVTAKPSDGETQDDGSPDPDPAAEDRPLSHSFRNYPGEDRDFYDFQGVLNYLVATGLTTSAKDGSKKAGPLLTSDQLSDPEGVARLMAAGLSLREVKPCDLSAADRRQLDLDPQSTDKDWNDKKKDRKCGGQAYRGLVYYQPVKSAEDYGPRHPTVDWNAKNATPSQREAMFNLCELVFHRSQEQGKNATNICSSPFKLDFSLQTRSPSQMLYFLGEVFRRWDRPDIQPNSRLIKVLEHPDPIRILGYDFPSAPCQSLAKPDPRSTIAIKEVYITERFLNCRVLFNMIRGDIHYPNVYSVTYQGETYYIPISSYEWRDQPPNRHLLDACPDNICGEEEASRPDRADTDLTFTMLEIMEEVMALNQSSKDLPATNILNITPAN